MEISYKLENFEGPLDLLLQLIAKNKLNIYDIKISVLVDQYLDQIEKMRQQEMEVASEFLQMASRLIYIKTVSLLPVHEDEAEKLREELTGALIEYDKCRKVALFLSKRTAGFDTFVKGAEEIEFDKTYRNVHEPELLTEGLIAAIGRGQRKLPPKTDVFKKIVAKKIVSVSSKIVFVLRNLVKKGRQRMSSLYDGAESRSELVATFLAVLELCKANRIEIKGVGNDAEITVKKENKHSED